MATLLQASDDALLRGTFMTYSVKESILRFMRCAERAGAPAARFFASGLSRDKQFEICRRFGVALSSATAELFEVFNGLKTSPGATIGNLSLVLHFGPLDLENACEHFRAAVEYGGMPSEFFPIFWDCADGLICVVQQNIGPFEEGSIVFWDPVSGVQGRFKTLHDFFEFACISIKECSLPQGGIDSHCAILNANKHAKMVDPGARVYQEPGSGELP